MKKPSYKKLQQMLTDAEEAFRQVNAVNLNQGSELVQLRETIKKLSNDLEHKDRSLRENYASACNREAGRQAELSDLRVELFIADNRATAAERRVKELEAKLEAVRLVIR